MKRLLLSLLLALLAYAITGVFFVAPDELVLVRRFGRALEQPYPPGAHLGLPWGLDRRDRIRPREVKRLSLGIVPVASAALGSTSPQLITGDRNLVHIEASIQYTVADPLRYLYHANAVGRFAEQVGLAMLAEEVCSRPVDLVLTNGQSALGIAAQNRIQSVLESYQAGIHIRSVDIRAVDPPLDVAAAFSDVVAALREKQQQINEANSYARRTVSRAEAEAQRIRDAAAAEQSHTVRKAEGETASFTQLLVEYQRAPQLTAQRLYLETIAETLPRFRSKLIIATGQDLDLSIIRQEEP